MIELTERERQVLELLAEGLSNRGIGENLWLSENTVKSHLSTLAKKVGAKGRAHVVARGFQLGLLKIERAA